MDKKAKTWIGIWLGIIVAVFVSAKLLGSTLKLLIFAAALAYFTRPIVEYLEKYRIKRFITVVAVFSLVTGLFILAGTLLIPFTMEQITELIRELPTIATSVLNLVSDFALKWNIPLNLQVEDLIKYGVSHVQEFLKHLSSSDFSSIRSLLTNTLSTVLWVLNLFLFPVFFFFIVQDYEKIAHFLKGLVPPAYRAKTNHYAYQFDRVLSGYIRGQLIVCLCLGSIYAIGLTLIGVRFGFLLGIIAGILTIVPYVGAAVALLGGMALALAYSAPLPTYFGVLIVYGIAQTLEGVVLVPRLVGNRVGLDTLTTMLVLIAGANVGGFLGMIVAIPLGGILKIILTDLIRYYRKSNLYT